MFQENLFQKDKEARKRKFKKGASPNQTFESFVKIPLDFREADSRNHSQSRQSKQKDFSFKKSGTFEISEQEEYEIGVLSSARVSNSANKRQTAESEIIYEGVASEESVNISQISYEEKQRDLEELKISDAKLQ